MGLAMAFANSFSSGALNSLDSLLPESAREQAWRSGWQDYQTDIENRLAIYRNDWYDLLVNHIAAKMSLETRNEFFPRNAAPLVPIPISVNILRYVINQINKIYMTPALRRFIVIGPIDENGEKATDFDKRYSDITKDSPYQSTMQLANQLANVCGCVLVRPIPDEREKSGFSFQIITPDQFTPIQDPDTPGRLAGLTYVIDSVDSDSANISTRKEVIIFRGTKSDPEPFMAERSGNQKIVKQPYPWIYQGETYLPFTVFRAEGVQAGEFVNRTYACDLVSATFDVAELKSDWLQSYKTGTFKQLVVTGAAGEGITNSFIMNRMRIETFPYDKAQSEIKQLDHSVDVKMQHEAIDLYIGGALANYGLSIDDFKGVAAKSGVAIKLDNQSLIDIIQLQRELFSFGESELADIIRKENNRVLPSGKFGKISDAAEFQLDYGRLPFDDDPQDQIAEQMILIENNIKSHADLLLEINPDLKTIENAQAQIMVNAKLNREARSGIILNNANLGAVEAELPPPIEDSGNVATPLLDALNIEENI